MTARDTELSNARERLRAHLESIVGAGPMPRYEEALTHRSHANETKMPDNQRLEFLGDRDPAFFGRLDAVEDLCKRSDTFFVRWSIHGGKRERIGGNLEVARASSRPTMRRVLFVGRLLARARSSRPTQTIRNPPLVVNSNQ